MLVLILWFVPSWAKADEDSTPVVVDVQSCSHYEQERVVHLLRVDLGDRFLSSFAPGALELQVICQKEGALVRARRGGGPQAVRSLEAAEVGGDVGARVLSLKAIELLREVKKEVPLEEEAPPASSVRRPQAGPRVRILGGVELTSFSLQPPLVGGEGSVELLVPPPLYFRVSGGASAAGRRYELGQVEARLISFRGEAGVRMALDAAGFGGGLGYRLGHARLSGRAATGEQIGSVVSGFWGGPYATLLSDLRVGRVFTFRVGAEVGKVVTEVRGTVSDEEDVAIAGVWGGLSFLMGASF